MQGWCLGNMSRCGLRQGTDRVFLLLLPVRDGLGPGVILLLIPHLGRWSSKVLVTLILLVMILLVLRLILSLLLVLMDGLRLVLLLLLLLLLRGCWRCWKRLQHGRHAIRAIRRLGISSRASWGRNLGNLRRRQCLLLGLLSLRRLLLTLWVRVH